MNKVEIFLIFATAISWLGIVWCMIEERYAGESIDNLLRIDQLTSEEIKVLREIIYDLKRKMILIEQEVRPIYWNSILEEAEAKYKEKLK